MVKFSQISLQIFEQQNCYMAEHLPHILNLEAEGGKKKKYILCLLADYYRKNTLQYLVCGVLILWFILIIHSPHLRNGNNNSLICLLFVGKEKKINMNILPNCNEAHTWNLFL